MTYTITKPVVSNNSLKTLTIEELMILKQVIKIHPNTMRYVRFTSSSTFVTLSFRVNRISIKKTITSRYVTKNDVNTLRNLIRISLKVYAPVK